MSDIAALKKAYRKAVHVSNDYRYAEEELQSALKYLDLAGHDTSVLNVELECLQAYRAEARTARKQAAAAYYTAVAEARTENAPDTNA